MNAHLWRVRGLSGQYEGLSFLYGNVLELVVLYDLQAHVPLQLVEEFLEIINPPLPTSRSNLALFKVIVVADVWATNDHHLQLSFDASETYRDKRAYRRQTGAGCTPAAIGMAYSPQSMQRSRWHEWDSVQMRMKRQRSVLVLGPRRPVSVPSQVR